MKTLLLSIIAAALGSAAFLTTPASAQVPNLVNYQGRVAVGGVNFSGSGQFEFALVNTNGSVTYWSNDGTSSDGSQPATAVTLTVANGLYSVLLGDASVTNMTAVPASVWTNADVRLRVWFNDGTHGFQLLTPDQRLAPNGYLPDGSVSGNALAANAVTSAKLASGAVTSADLAPGAVAPPVSVSGTTQTAATNTDYVATNASATTFTLPTTANVGDVVQVSGAGAGGWTVQAGAGQAVANPWTQQTNGLPASAVWESVASSSDGTYQVAVVYGGGLYTSANSGAAWTQQTSGLPTNTFWRSVASSADGTHLVAVVLGGGLYTSANSGAAWTQQTSGLPSNPQWISVASSADGTQLVAVVENGGLYTSANSGTSWTQQTSGLPASALWFAVASSADGTHLVAMIYDGGLFTSVNSGASWTQQTSGLPANPQWISVASSADGTHLVAVVYGGGLYTSANSGTSWTQQTSGLPVNPLWQSVASSADGTHLLAAVYGGGLYTSTNSGTTWTQQTSGLPSTPPWFAVASSADGSHLFALVQSGGFYTTITNVSGTQGATAAFQYLGNGQWTAVAQTQVAAGAVGSTQLASSIASGLWTASGADIYRASGNVGIGTTTPTYSLQLATDSAGKPNGGSWANSSDRRIKQDILPMQDALERLTRLRGVTFAWRHPEDHANQSGPQAGFIAQEVEALFPQWVTEVNAAEHDRTLTDNGKIKSLTLPFEFDALVVESIKQQQAEIAAKDSEIAALKKRLAELEAKDQARDAALEARLHRLEQAVPTGNPVVLKIPLETAHLRGN